MVPHLRHFSLKKTILPVRGNDCYTAFWDCMDGTVVRHWPEIRPVHKATAAYKLFIFENYEKKYKLIKSCTSKLIINFVTSLPDVSAAGFPENDNE